MDWLIWLVAGVVLLGIEAVTLAFVAVYFGVAALVAALCAAIGAPLWLQIVVFCAVSVLGLAMTRRIATRVLKGPVVKTNVHSLAGRRGIVTKPITGDDGRGQVRLGSDYWTARPYFDDGVELPEGTRVEVVKIEGATAVVVPIELAP